jgi:hypothetical protein
MSLVVREILRSSVHRRRAGTDNPLNGRLPSRLQHGDRTTCVDVADSTGFGDAGPDPRLCRVVKHVVRFSDKLIHHRRIPHVTLNQPVVGVRSCRYIATPLNVPMLQPDIVEWVQRI